MKNNRFYNQLEKIQKQNTKPDISSSPYKNDLPKRKRGRNKKIPSTSNNILLNLNQSQINNLRTQKIKYRMQKIFLKNQFDNNNNKEHIYLPNSNKIGSNFKIFENELREDNIHSEKFTNCLECNKPIQSTSLSDYLTIKSIGSFHKSCFNKEEENIK